MAWTSDYSVFRLFVSKKINVYDATNPKIKITLRIPSFREKFDYPYINIFLTFFNQGLDKFKTLFSALNLPCENDFDALKCIYASGYWKELEPYYVAVKQALNFFLDSEVVLDKNEFTIVDQGMTLDRNLWDYIIYLLRTSEGMKVEPPRTFKSEADRKRYEDLLKQEERIRKIRATGNKIKTESGESMDTFTGFLIIMQAFPQYTMDDLLDLATCQIVSLQQSAAKIVRFDVEKRAYAAGNLKKLKYFWQN